MTRSLTGFALLATALLGASSGIGYDTVYRLSFGTHAILSLITAAVYLWLWLVRSTPLALGITLSWMGAAMLTGWWWSYSLLGRPEWMLDQPVLFVFLSLYLAGAAVHFLVIQRSLDLPRLMFLGPLCLAFAAAAGVHLVF